MPRQSSTTRVVEVGDPQGAGERDGGVKPPHPKAADARWMLARLAVFFIFRAIFGVTKSWKFLSGAIGILTDIRVAILLISYDFGLLKISLATVPMPVPSSV